MRLQSRPRYLVINYRTDPDNRRSWLVGKLGEPGLKYLKGRFLNVMNIVHLRILDRKEDNEDSDFIEQQVR